MIQDIEPQRFNNQYSNRREPEDHDMVLSFSEKMIFAKVMDDENLLGFMTYGELQKITGCDRKIGDLVYLFSIDDTAYFMWNGDNRLAAPGYEYRDGCFAFQGRNRLKEGAGGVLAGRYGYVRLPEGRDL